MIIARVYIGYFGGTTDFGRDCARTRFNYEALEQFTWYRESVLLATIEDHPLIIRDHHHDSLKNSEVQGDMICTSQAVT